MNRACFRFHLSLHSLLHKIFSITADKERDLSSMTEKLRLQLNAAHKKHDDLSEEIQKLKVVNIFVFPLN